MDSRLKIWEFKLCPLSPYKDLPHGLDVLVTIIWPVRCLISTRVGVIMWTSCAKPIRESQEEQSFCLLALMSILSLDWRGLSPTALNPFFLQWGCNKTCELIRVFHVLRPNEVAWYFPSAINEYSELACLLMAMNLSRWPIFIPRQILEKGVFQ